MYCSRCSLFGQSDTLIDATRSPIETIPRTFSWRGTGRYRANVSALLQRALPSFDDLHFDAIVAGDEVAAKKPSPEVFEIALRQLRLHASCCVAFEDSSNGVIAAQRARLKVMATPSAYFSDDDFTGAHSVISHLGEPHHAHRHLAGWSWPGDFVTLAALHAWSEKISA
jgi:hypothetical protein